MTLDQLEFYLNRGDVMGFAKETDSDKYMGWISISKRKYNPRIEQIFSDKENLNLILEQKQIQERPYVVELCELRIEAYENEDKIPDTSDYRIADVLYFESLEQVSSFLEKYNKKFVDIKWLSEIPNF